MELSSNSLWNLQNKSQLILYHLFLQVWVNISINSYQVFFLKKTSIWYKNYLQTNVK